MTQRLDPTDDIAFRRVLGHFATGLTVVTAVLDGKRIGLTCQSFASVSLDPPLIAFFAERGSGAWAGIKKAEAFCVNVLGESQELTARIFSTPGIDKFHDVVSTASPNGSPILPGVIAWIDCSIDSVFDAGDHEGVLGRVEVLAHTADEMPLVYFRGGYGRFEP